MFRLFRKKSLERMERGFARGGNVSLKRCHHGSDKRLYHTPSFSRFRVFQFESGMRKGLQV